MATKDVNLIIKVIFVGFDPEETTWKEMTLSE